MPCYFKKLLPLILLTISSFAAPCQDLDHLPPLISRSPIGDTTTTFLFSTLTNRFESSAQKKYINSIQITDAAHPWPPRWYTGTTYYSPKRLAEDSAKGIMHGDFFMDARVQENYLSFFKLIAASRHDTVIAETQGYILHNKKLEAVDTITSKVKHDLYWHDLRLNQKGERLVDIKTTDTLDFRSVSGNAADSAVISDIDVIQILDTHNNVVFSWKANEKLDPMVFQYKESLHNRSFAKVKGDDQVIDWSHLTTALWDYDGNILYAMRFIGIGKINRKDGKLMWHVDFKDLPIISGQDTLEWFFPHDLNLVYVDDTMAVYSLYSLGNDKGKEAYGVLFKYNLKTKKVSLLKNFAPHKKIRGKGQGSFDYNLLNGDYAISYGIYEYTAAEDSLPFEDEIEYGNAQGVSGIFQLPKNVMAYKVHRLADWPLPPRPEVVLRDNVLEAVGEMKEWTWYKMTGPKNLSLMEVGKGRTLVPEPGATYCVAGKYGVGYCVSLAYVTQPNHNKPISILIVGALLAGLGGIWVFRRRRS